MRKLITVALLVFAMAFAFGSLTAEQPQAIGLCWYQCDCNGTPLYCCYGINGVVCKVVPNSPWNCTQQAGC